MSSNVGAGRPGLSRGNPRLGRPKQRGFQLLLEKATATQI